MADELKYIIDIATKGFSAASSKIKSFASMAKKSFKGLGKAISGAFGKAKYGLAGIVAGFVGTIREGARFEEQMAEVRTLLSDISDTDFKVLKRNVIDLSAEFGKAKEELVAGLYQALSAGVPKENVMDFLRVAATAAVAGVSTVEEAVDTLNAVLNAYGMSAKEAGKVSDMLFATIDAGSTTMPQLSSAIGDVASLASTANIPLEDLLGSLAAMTIQSQSTSKSVTAIRSAILGVIKPSKELEAKFREIGTTGEQMLTEKGFAETMAQIAEFAKGSTEAMTILIPKMEALPALTQLTGKNMDVTRKKIEGITNSIGKSKKALDDINKSNFWKRLWQSALAGVTQVGLAINDRLAPHVEELIKKINNIRGSRAFDAWVTKISSKLDKAVELAKMLSSGSDAERAAAVEEIKDTSAAFADSILKVMMPHMQTLGDAFGTAAIKAISLAPVKLGFAIGRKFRKEGAGSDEGAQREKIRGFEKRGEKETDKQYQKRLADRYKSLSMDNDEYLKYQEQKLANMLKLELQYEPFKKTLNKSIQSSDKFFDKVDDFNNQTQKKQLDSLNRMVKKGEEFKAFKSSLNEGINGVDNLQNRGKDLSNAMMNDTLGNETVTQLLSNINENTRKTNESLEAK